MSTEDQATQFLPTSPLKTRASGKGKGKVETVPSPVSCQQPLPHRDKLKTFDRWCPGRSTRKRGNKQADDDTRHTKTKTQGEERAQENSPVITYKENPNEGSESNESLSSCSSMSGLNMLSSDSLSQSGESSSPESTSSGESCGKWTDLSDEEFWRDIPVLIWDRPEVNYQEEREQSDGDTEDTKPGNLLEDELFKLLEEKAQKVGREKTGVNGRVDQTCPIEITRFAETRKVMRKFSKDVKGPPKPQTQSLVPRIRTTTTPKSPQKNLRPKAFVHHDKRTAVRPKDNPERFGERQQ